jgi:hypothetical protein
VLLLLGAVRLVHLVLRAPTRYRRGTDASYPGSEDSAERARTADTPPACQRQRPSGCRSPARSRGTPTCVHHTDYGAPRCMLQCRRLRRAPLVAVRATCHAVPPRMSRVRSAPFTRHSSAQLSYPRGTTPRDVEDAVRPRVHLRQHRPRLGRLGQRARSGQPSLVTLGSGLVPAWYPLGTTVRTHGLPHSCALERLSDLVWDEDDKDQPVRESAATVYHGKLSPSRQHTRYC